jgi:hypothetical protein
MNKKLIRLTENDLHRIIEESVMSILAENEMEEGWFGDKWNQTKSAVGTAFNGEGNFGQRLQNARKNWNTQGDLNGINNLQQQLTQMLNARQISPQTTVAQLVGGKYNNNKFGTMTGMAANRRGQISKRGGSAY